MNSQQEDFQTPPANYLVWAILTTVLCCLPLGIVSIIYAAQVNSKWMAGDYAGAQNSSRKAKTWAWVSFGAAILGAVIWFVLAILGVVVGGFLGLFDF
ncbi:CD225/dispanin family protein [Maribellus maritimus]|uniref:CD225/dispanin family protein n=1 Tax=Maribellus maritimus TaxID=2870838 RepID=UPI001EECAB4F|nr:CD225/dispanin family protein [Maribellus maritimus]MCG6188971.1 CD225/dispanin family protein [Maribellus maritimus]